MSESNAEHIFGNIFYSRIIEWNNLFDVSEEIYNREIVCSETGCYGNLGGIVNTYYQVIRASCNLDFLLKYATSSNNIFQGISYWISSVSLFFRLDLSHFLNNYFVFLFYTWHISNKHGLVLQNNLYFYIWFCHIMYFVILIYSCLYARICVYYVTEYILKYICIKYNIIIIKYCNLIP